MRQNLKKNDPKIPFNKLGNALARGPRGEKFKTDMKFKLDIEMEREKSRLLNYSLDSNMTLTKRLLGYRVKEKSYFKVPGVEINCGPGLRTSFKLFKPSRSMRPPRFFSNIFP